MNTLRGLLIIEAASLIVAAALRAGDVIQGPFDYPTVFQDKEHTRHDYVQGHPGDQHEAKAWAR